MRVASSMLVLAAAMTLPVGARAAEADTMRVTGAITANNACSTSIQNGGNINFGVIPVSSLQSTTNLDLRALAVTISCSTPTYIALQLHEMGDGTEGEHRLGLGLVRPDTPIGYYEIRHSAAVTVNGTAGYMVDDPSPGPGSGAWWGSSYPFDAWYIGVWRSFAHAVEGNGVAQPITTAQFTLEIRATIHSQWNLGITGATPINGQFIMEMLYM